MSFQSTSNTTLHEMQARDRKSLEIEPTVVVVLVEEKKSYEIQEDSRWV